MAEQTKTVKVPVRIEETDKNIRNLKYRAVKKIMYEARTLGNMGIRYAIAYSMEGIDLPADPDKKGGKVARSTQIYRQVSPKRKFLPSGALAMLLKQFAEKEYDAARKNTWNGKKSLPTFRSIFFPFRAQGTSIFEIQIKGDCQFKFGPAGFTTKNWLSDELVEACDGNPATVPPESRPLVLTSVFSYKDTGSIEIIKRICDGTYKLCDSQLREGKKGLMLALSFQFTPESVALDKKNVCGVDLGYAIPAVCAKNNGLQRRFLGDSKDISDARAKFRAMRRRSQSRMGLVSKTRNWKPSDKEKNWINTYYHALTREVIKFCLKEGCGTIHIEDLSSLREKEMEEGNEFKRLIWVPSKFREQLTYKAKEAGIELVAINPKNTSRRCTECGHTVTENRKNQKNFQCVKCPHKANADYNAAVNIARARGDVIKNGYPDTVL